MARLRRHLPTILVAMATAAVTAAAPAVADGVQHALFAHNSDKTDGKHAVGANAGDDKRAGKLVATNGNGELPAGAIPVETFQLFDTNGPLPIQSEIELEGGSYVVMGSGSGFRPNTFLPSGLIGMRILFTRESLPNSFGTKIQASEDEGHKTFVPFMKTMAFQEGSYTVTLSETDDAQCGTVNETATTTCTETDSTDSFQVTLLRVP